MAIFSLWPGLNLIGLNLNLIRCVPARIVRFHQSSGLVARDSVFRVDTIHSATTERGIEQYHGLNCVSPPPPSPGSGVGLSPPWQVQAWGHSSLPWLARVWVAPSDLGLWTACLRAVTVVHQSRGLVHNSRAGHDGSAFSWKAKHRKLRGYSCTDLGRPFIHAYGGVLECIARSVCHLVIAIMPHWLSRRENHNFSDEDG